MIKPKLNLVSPNKHNIKCPNAMDPESITIHNTYNDASAENEVKYMTSNNNEVSFHFAIDDKEVVQGIPLNRNAWAAGDGNGPGNRKSIHIEICYSKSGGTRYYQAEGLTVQFVAQLLKERGWGVERVKKHQDWSGKNCPHRILAEGRWDSFKNAVAIELKKLNSIKVKPKPSNKPTGGLYKVQVGAFKDKKNAEAQAAKLKAAGFQAFVTK
ncbi:N-acetylmuramoyl-L-alanine amidase [Mesobacillus zeae]|uniref:N-acetylmuramoyl-L-alanine amidase n=1 Tax=Mesobacillus zeae TaxID=1917180 RepID=A0A398B877_9BACI|nr:N-acetylmuramoyl-L-alanine amidase [Mesobacillus zeae]RID85684.1 N-acetylmuramoyl-L-alanine amidase [Mesobacillus zeae]